MCQMHVRQVHMHTYLGGEQAGEERRRLMHMHMHTYLGGEQAGEELRRLGDAQVVKRPLDEHLHRKELVRRLEAAGGPPLE